ncbi:MAG: TonB-dependent receptor [Flavobacteriaceae bacterium]|nr:TonB-dependent receptor [Flavobacteriaceae bacterium]
MTKNRKLTLLFFFFIAQFVNSQNKIPLREYLDSVSQKFTYDFSFKDADVSSHFVNISEISDIETVLQFLRNNTLFQFTVLNDRTIAISKKENLLSLCGNIMNAENNSPFNNVTITSRYQQVISDEDGDFSMLALSPNDNISIQYAGFNDLNLKSGELVALPCTTLSMRPKVEFLNTVTLSNYFAKGISKAENGSLKVKYSEFDILPGLIEPDVLLTIQALPGIQSVNETVSFINIRGGTNDQNLILWDGIKMYQNGHFFGLISAFNPFLTEVVNLTKNGTTAALGDGVSGVISMEGNSEINQDLKAGIGVNLISTDAFVDIPLGKDGSIQVSGRKSINNIVRTPTFDSYFDRAFQNTEVTSAGNVLPTSDDEFSFFDGSFRLLLKPSEKDEIRANFLALGNSLKFLENGEIENEFQSLRSNLIQNNISGGLFYRRIWNDKFNTEVQAYGTIYELEATNFDVINDQRLLQENNVDETGIRIKHNYRVSESIQGTLGYQLNETGITNFEQINNPFFERTEKQVIVTNSFFAEATFVPKKNLFLMAGVRANHIGKFNEILFEPRLSLNYQFLKYFNFEILGEFKSQTTSQIIDFQNDFLGVENRRWVLSSPDVIPIIKGRQISAGLTMNRKGWLVSAEPYLKEVRGISSQSQGFQNQFLNERVNGSFTTYGVDLLVNKRFKYVNTWLSYSYAKNDYNFEDLVPQKFHNNIDIRHTITYGLNCSFDDFNISGGFNYHTGKPTTSLVEGMEIVDGELNFASPNAKNIKDYLRVDISGTYTFKVSPQTTAYLGASIWNLLDNDNVVNHFFRINNDEEIEEVDEFALGFTPNFSFRLTF